MKKTIIILTFLIFNLSFSQKKGGEAIYIFIPKKHQVSENSKNAVLNKLYENSLKASKNIIYHLNFNKKESHFWMEKILNPDNVSKIGVTMINFGEFYVNSNGEILKKISLYGENILVENDVNNFKWKIENTTKNINGFTCYKATFVKVVNNQYKTKQLITAWYAPSISFYFGPAGYAGLPGFIMELDIQKRGTFKLKKIELTNNETKIKFNKDIKHISQTEFNQLSKKMYHQLTEK